jgi:hypothetical protein
MLSMGAGVRSSDSGWALSAFSAPSLILSVADGDG